MGAIFVSWGISGAVLLGLAIAVGVAVTSRIDGILIDERGRYSLTHLQLCLWTIVILSLISGVFSGAWCTVSARRRISPFQPP